MDLLLTINFMNFATILSQNYDQYQDFIGFYSLSFHLVKSYQITQVST